MKGGRGSSLDHVIFGFITLLFLSFLIRKRRNGKYLTLNSAWSFFFFFEIRTFSKEVAPGWILEVDPERGGDDAHSFPTELRTVLYLAHYEQANPSHCTVFLQEGEHLPDHLQYWSMHTNINPYNTCMCWILNFWSLVSCCGTQLPLTQLCYN